MKSRAHVFALVACVITTSACNAILGIQDPIDEPTIDATNDALTNDVGDTRTTQDGTPNESAVDARAETTSDSTLETAIDSTLDSPVETSIDSSVDDTTDTTPPPVDTSCTSPYAAAVLADSPLAYWHLDEPAGSTTAHDAVGGHDGGYTTTGVTFGIDGAVPCSKAVHFTKDTGGMAATLAPFAGIASFSIDGWFEPASLDLSAPWLVLGRTDGTTGWGLYDSETESIFVRSISGTSNQVSGATMPTAFGWSYFAVTYDGATLSLYIHLSSGSMMKTTGSSFVSLPDDTTTFTLGYDGVGVPTTGGGYDEIAIYGHVLTDTQIANHYAAH